MLSYEDKILNKVLKQFDGLTKLQIFDLLQRIEALLVYQKSPVQFSTLQKSLIQVSNKKVLFPLSDDGYAYLDDSCRYIDIYRIKTIFSPLLGGGNIYFSKSKDSQINLLNDKNLIEAFDNTPLKNSIHQFLQEHRIKKRNPKTRRLLLLDILDKIDVGI